MKHSEPQRELKLKSWPRDKPGGGRRVTQDLLEGAESKEQKGGKHRD